MASLHSTRSTALKRLEVWTASTSACRPVRMEWTTWASPWARWTCPRPTAPRTTVTSSDETAAHSPAPESMPPPRRMAGQRQTCDLRPPASNKHLMTSPTHQCPIREPNYLQMFHWKEANCFLAVSLPLAIFESGYLADGKFLPFLGVSNNRKEGWGVICLWRAESVFIRERGRSQLLFGSTHMPSGRGLGTLS